VESFHAWVRSEYEAKGYVEVDDDYIAQGVLLRQYLEEDELFALAFGPKEGVDAGDDGVAPRRQLDEMLKSGCLISVYL
jgi:hypothetical protein